MKKPSILLLSILILVAFVWPSTVMAGGTEVGGSAYPIANQNILQNNSAFWEYSSQNTLHKVYIGSEESAPQLNDISSKKLVCLTFDDGWQNQYDNALPILQQYGFKATFSVVTTWIGNGSGAQKAMGMDMIHELANQGMDISSHTRTHPHLPTLEAGDLQIEVANSKTDLEQAGFTVKTFVYPYFEYNEAVISSAIDAGYICARAGALGHAYDPCDTSDPDARYHVDAIEINTQSIAQFQSIVDQASEHAVSCLCYHSVSDDTGSPTPRTPVTNFSEQMSYLNQNGFTVVLLPDLIQSPWISVSPTSLTFGGTEGGSNPASQTLSISNTGGGTLNWTAVSDAAWLTFNPASGSCSGSSSPVTVTANINGLSAGTYNASITISASGATNTPQVVPVTLTVQAAPANWLNGWSYRKQVMITGSTGGAQTGYQMKLTVNRSEGTDSGSMVYVGTKCAADYSDLRFTKDDGLTLLDYWIESSDSNSAMVWVELDSIPASPGTANFDVYYGNSVATSCANIQNTFVFGDDFEDGVLDTARWTTGGGTAGSVSEASGVLAVTAGASNQKYAASISTYNNAYVLHARAKMDSVTGCSSYRLLGFVTTKGTYADKYFTTAFRWYYGDTTFWGISGNGSKASLVNMNAAVNTNYHISECRRYASGGTNYDRFIINGGTEIVGSKPTTISRYIYINSDEPSKAIMVDWIFLRKFVSPQPVWSIWGSEETN